MMNVQVETAVTAEDGALGELLVATSTVGVLAVAAVIVAVMTV